jgi:predicted metalloprotease
MRLDDLDQSSNVEDRRGQSGGGGGFGLPIGGGGLGIGTIIILGLIGWALGIDPRVLIGGAEILSGGNNSQIQQPAPRQTRTGAPSDDMGTFVAKVLGSTETQWKAVFQEGGKTYRAPILVMYNGRTAAAGCGAAQSAMGPFYCPSDQKIYLDTAFFQELENRFHGCSGKSCQFAEAYVIAHEVGHHVQNQLGVLPKVQQQQQQVDKVDANQLQVRVELQADCLAGVWAARENQTLQREGKPPFIDQSDVEAAMQTASAIGDDTLQRKATGRVVPDAFTHGSSAQRQRWFTTGLKEGNIAACNTFRANNI